MLPHELQPECALRLRAETGGKRAQKTLHVRIRTDAALGDTWLEPGAVVEARRVRGGALRISLGPELQGVDASVVGGAGETRIEPGARRSAAPMVLGFGEALTVVGGCAWEDGPRRELAGRVEDHGEVAGHEARDGRLVLETLIPIELDDEYWLAVWPRRGPPMAVNLESNDETGTVLRSELYGDAVDVRAVALCFRNTVLGASWADTWSEDLGELDSGVVVGLIQALRLPVLAEPHSSRVQQALEAGGVPQSLFALATPRPLVVGPHRVEPRVDGCWRPVARTLALRLRLARESEVTRLRDLLYREIESTDPRPDIRPPASADVRAALREWNRRHGDVEEHALLHAGVLQPLDAVDVIVHRRDAYARRLVDAACGLTYDGLEALEKRQRTSLRRKFLEQARHRLRGAGVVDSLLREARNWASTRDSQPTTHLLRALLHERAHRLLQLELLSDRLPTTP